MAVRAIFRLADRFIIPVSPPASARKMIIGMTRGMAELNPDAPTV